MKPRTSEAARLERDYLDRVRRALKQRDQAEVEEIIQSLEEHLEEEFSKGLEEEVGLGQMASVLESLGPPGSFRQEESPSVSGDGSNFQMGNSSEMPSGASPKARADFAEVLDKIWAGYLIVTVGLYVPSVYFPISAFIGGILLAVVLLHLPPEGYSQMRRAGRFIVAEIAFMLAGLGLSSLALPHPDLSASIVRILIGLAQGACALIACWKILGCIGSFVVRAGHLSIGQSIYSTRKAYLLVVLLVSPLIHVTTMVVTMANGCRNRV